MFCDEAGNNIFGGIRIHENRHFQQTRGKVELSPGDYVSPDFRRNTNQWLKDFFGEERYVLMYDPSVFPFPGPLGTTEERYVLMAANPCFIADSITLEDIKKAAKLIL